MLEILRNAANSWVLKPLLALLVLAFVLWGIAGAFTDIFQGRALATVGGTELSAQEYQRTMGMVMDNLERRYGRRPTPDQIRANQIDREVLGQLINSTLLDVEARQLGLALPQRSVVAEIEKDPEFQAPTGGFDSAAFNVFLRERGYSERGWVAYRQREEIRRQLTAPLFQELPVPAVLANLVHDFRDEKRTVQYFTLAPDKVVKVVEPDEKQLKETYESRKPQFVTPEYRNLGVLRLSVDDIKARILAGLSDDEIRKTYDAEPARRHVQQLSFKDKAAAEAARKAIAGGKSFLDIAKENGASESDTDLGVTTKAEMIDPKIADAAFGLPSGEVSQPIEGRFATVLVRATVVGFDDVKIQIREKLAQSRANDELHKLGDAVEDGRSAGKSLKEIGTSLGIPYIEISGTDRLGRKADGTAAYDGKDIAAIVQAGFEGKSGVESDPVELADGGAAWVEVQGVTAERQRPFDEVKADVAKVWKENDAGRQLNEAAAKLIERAGKGETITKLAGEVGGKLATSPAFTRAEEVKGLPAAVVQRTFGMALGGVGSTEAQIEPPAGDQKPETRVDAGAKTRVVFRLVRIEKAPPATKEQVDQISSQLRSEFQQDAVQAYVGALRQRLGVTVNESVFKQTAGTGSDAP